MTRLTKKFDHKWLGAYLIEKVILQSAYRLKLPLSFGQTHLVFSVTLLRPYSTDTIAKCIQQDPPPPVIKDGVEEYEVEHILDSRIFRNIWYTGRVTGSKRTSGGWPKTSKAQN